MNKPPAKKLQIAILGTRGIPNRYGGFEQWAEQLSKELVLRGNDVTVYNSHFHPFKKDTFNGVKIIRKWDPEKIGLASQFIYDLLCIVDTRKRNYDVIIQLGYTTSSVWAWMHPKKSKVIYNMDGMEWKREKYKGILSSFLKFAEKLAVKNSTKVIADSKPIKQYLDAKYNINSFFIPYPAEIFRNPDESTLKKFNLKKNSFYLIIARFQPDNNPETIIKGIINSNTSIPLVVIGNLKNNYAKRLKKKYESKKIIFLGGIYDKTILNNLRYFSLIYFHGHSAGGTNPSLLEAMGTSCIICAHDNEFNKAILEGEAFYFKSSNEISSVAVQFTEKSSKAHWIQNNLNKLQTFYNLTKIVDEYQKLF
jgi:hypothetical protein